MSTTNITLIVNGEIADFKAILAEMVQELNTKGQPIKFEPEFIINPDTAYKATDVRLQKMLGFEKYAHPAKAIITAMRRHGISPICIKRAGTLIFGSQVLEYFNEIKASQTTYLKAN
jgi:hypothetical protein